MGRLHAEGYTFEAIREALADAGVVVSNTTVQREVARLRSQSRPGPPAHTDAPPG
jgi:spermidine synthase